MKNQKLISSIILGILYICSLRAMDQQPLKRLDLSVLGRQIQSYESRFRSKWQQKAQKNSGQRMDLTNHLRTLPVNQQRALQIWSSIKQRVLAKSEKEITDEKQQQERQDRLLDVSRQHESLRPAYETYRDLVMQFQSDCTEHDQAWKLYNAWLTWNRISNDDQDRGAVIIIEACFEELYKEHPGDYLDRLNKKLPIVRLPEFTAARTALCTAMIEKGLKPEEILP
jgi:hypothetical protein